MLNSQSTWICPNLDDAEYRDNRNRDVSLIFGTTCPYWPYHNWSDKRTDLLGRRIPHPTKFKANPQQPYLMRGGAFPSKLQRPMEAVNLEGIFPVNAPIDIMRRKQREISGLVEAVEAAVQGQTCQHRGPYFGYRLGDSPIFFPCEARAVLGATTGQTCLERLLKEVQALQSLYNSLIAYLSLTPNFSWVY